MKIATWNINSIRLRLEQVTNFLKQKNIDILCLQETKTPDEFFPKYELEKLVLNINIIEVKNLTMVLLFYQNLN